MPRSNKPRAPIENQLLAALPEEQYQRLLPELEFVTLGFAEVLYEPAERIRHVYFPVSGLIAMLSTINKRSTTAVKIVGKEGMTGISVFLDVATASNRAIVAAPGAALRMKATVLRRESMNGLLAQQLLRYTRFLLTQSHQATICNHYHFVKERVASWMLYLRDNVESDEFPMTQELMSNMIGVRREEVNKAAIDLQQNKLISYSRGRVKILDRAGLEAVCCKCYWVLKRESENVLDL